MNAGPYLVNLAISVDQLANAITNGTADETLSARAHRMHMKRRRSWPRHLINALFFWQEDHCRSAYISELKRKHLPPEYQIAAEKPAA